MVVVGGSVYDENVGKTIVTDTAEIYNIEANTWSYGEDIYKYPIPARNMACVTWNGCVLLSIKIAENNSEVS